MNVLYNIPVILAGSGYPDPVPKFAIRFQIRAMSNRFSAISYDHRSTNKF